MKSNSFCLLAALVVLPAAATEAPKKVAMRDVATHEQIVEAAREAKEKNPMSVFKPTEGGDPSVLNKPVDILKRSDILCYGNIATLVPKRAIIHLPKALADRVGIKDGVGIVSWVDFLNANRAWISTVQVSRVQAEGNQPFPEAMTKALEKEKRMVVAVYQDGPISVLPLKTPPPPVETAANAKLSVPNVAKP